MTVPVKEIPRPVVAFVANSILAQVPPGLTVGPGHDVFWSAIHPRRVPWTPAVLSTRSLSSRIIMPSSGSVNVVVPVFGPFIEASSAVSIVVLDERLTGRTALGFPLAVIGFWLVAVE